MRANLAMLADPAGASRAVAITSLQRVNREQVEKATQKAAPVRLLLADSAGSVWEITVDTKGALSAKPYKGSADGPPTKR